MFKQQYSDVSLPIGERAKTLAMTEQEWKAAYAVHSGAGMKPPSALPQASCNYDSSGKFCGDNEDQSKFGSVTKPRDGSIDTADTIMDDCRRHQVDRAHDGLNDVLDLMSEHESLDLSVGQNIGSHNQDGSMKPCMINLSKCTKQEKARYWSRVFGGMPTKRPAQMSKHQVIEGFDVADVDIGDEPVKHKGKFKRESFPRT